MMAKKKQEKKKKRTGLMSFDGLLTSLFFVQIACEWTLIDRFETVWIT